MANGRKLFIVLMFQIAAPLIFFAASPFFLPVLLSRTEDEEADESEWHDYRPWRPEVVFFTFYDFSVLWPFGRPRVQRRAWSSGSSSETCDSGWYYRRTPLPVASWR